MEPRRITFYKDYFADFFNDLSTGVQEKITYVLRYIQQTEQWARKFVRYMGEGLFELRVEWKGNIYRVFFILDEGNIVVLFNGFQKKSQKTPARELEKAYRIKKEYYDTKQQSARL